jgi:hypothetical protein
MVNLVPTSGGVVANADSWHDYVQYSSNNLWQACLDMTATIGAVNGI